MSHVVNTDAVSRQIARMMRENGQKWLGVTFVKKDGSERTMTCHVRKVEGHQGHNNAEHFEKYVTVVLAEKDDKGNPQFRNVNVETITRLAIGGRVIEFK
ncbi:hypothetical protein D3C80_937880 [compost metagenome]